MSIRYSTSLLGLCVATAAAGLLAPAAAQQWVMPRTPDGHPDLQGNWNNATLTPFERPRGQGPVLTSDEVEMIEGRRLDQVIDGSRPSDPGRGPAPVTGRIGRSYNEIYYHRGERVAVVNGEPRSSLLTSPPNGRRGRPSRPKRSGCSRIAESPGASSGTPTTPSFARRPSVASCSLKTLAPRCCPTPSTTTTTPSSRRRTT